MEKEAFGKRINRVRKQQDLTSVKLGTMCETSSNFIRQIEGGLRLPSVPMLVKICNELNISPNYLLADSLNLSESEQYSEILNRIQLLTPKQLDMIKSMIETMIDNKDKE